MLRTNNRYNPNKAIVIEFGIDMFKSRAWLDLTGRSKDVYCLLLCRRQGERRKKMVGTRMKNVWTCTNNGKIYFTYEEAKKEFGISKGQFRRAIDQLVEHGLLKVTPGFVLKFGFVENWREYNLRREDKIKRRKYTATQRKNNISGAERAKLVERFQGKRKNLH